MLRRLLPCNRPMATVMSGGRAELRIKESRRVRMAPMGTHLVLACSGCKRLRGSVVHRQRRSLKSWSRGGLPEEQSSMRSMRSSCKEASLC